MKNAIILLVHHLPEQVNIFLKQILEGTTMDIYIHINKLLDDGTLRAQLLKNDRIKISNNNVAISWGDDGIMKAYLHLMKEAIESGEEYNYILLGTGQDLLIRPGIDQFLEKQNNRIFIYGYEDNKERRSYVMHHWSHKYRRMMNFKLNPYKVIRRFRIEFFKKFQICEKKTKVDVSNWTFYYNDMWAAYPAEVAKYLVDYWQNNTDFMDMFNDALVPEEAYFLTVIMRSEYKKWVLFDENGRSNDLYRIRGIANGHPYVNTTKDIKDLDDSNQYLSRKFDIRKDKNIIDYYFNKVVKQ